MVMAATTSTTTNCSHFFNVRSNDDEPKLVRPSPPTAHGSPAASGSGCGKLDGVIMWFVNGVATVFFASLERCSCVRITTADDGEEANDVPLIHGDGNVRLDAGTTRRKTAGKAPFLQD
ncbi:hypothetical protein ES288_A06G028600v1 [Gossypium darwinii]|uniref:Uncharacterized protein n=1 Tax=Gossypium darwinii TaxID=34276 RepID=A0A5D2G1N1_GOSDA|nr:hypothetical protein ES288_A06G028600v1 [Gossypium darwinii]